MKTGISIVFLMVCSCLSFAQDSTRVQPKLSFSAYADVYYAYDFANPSSHERPSFLYNHNRHNEVNLTWDISRERIFQKE